MKGPYKCKRNFDENLGENNKSEIQLLLVLIDFGNTRVITDTTFKTLNYWTILELYLKKMEVCNFIIVYPIALKIFFFCIMRWEWYRPQRRFCVAINDFRQGLF